MKRFLTLAGACMLAAACTTHFKEQAVTTQDKLWVSVDPKFEVTEGEEDTLTVDLKATGQTIQGFGTAFSELSYDALAALSEEDRGAVYEELFAPGKGASFNINRTPIGASDFARKYYSYDDVEGDFAMEHFSIDNDRTSLIPAIQTALSQNPDMKIWASPWCPPQWLKNNGHYASVATSPELLEAISGGGRRRGPGGPGGPGGFGGGMPPMSPEQMAELPPEIRAMIMQQMGGGQEPDNVIRDNGIAPEQVRAEGQDSFTLEPQYLEAYALYFKKYIEAYRAEGIDIYMVMPQNEPNSAQWYPSCTWTPDGLAQFEKYLGPAMEEAGVELYHGTMERADPQQAIRSIEDPESGQYIKGVAFQWAGKDALPTVHAQYPDLTMVMSEHQCHNGQNSWADFIDSWGLLKHYMDNGVSIYDYWNLALFEDGVSTWGWRQNSLVCVNRRDGSYRYTYEYYLMKHISHYVQPGAVYLGTSGFEEALAFRNPDGTVVVLACEKEGRARNLTLTAGHKSLHVYLPENSLSTIVL